MFIREKRTQTSEENERPRRKRQALAKGATPSFRTGAKNPTAKQPKGEKSEGKKRPNRLARLIVLGEINKEKLGFGTHVGRNIWGKRMRKVDGVKVKTFREKPYEAMQTKGGRRSS